MVTVSQRMAKQLGRDRDPEITSRRKAAQPMWTVHIDDITQSILLCLISHRGLVLFVTLVLASLVYGWH